MSAFDKIIGYESIKSDLLGIIDIIKNPEIYKALGAEIPRGVFLEGDPGMGKTMMAQAFIDECKIPSFVIRRTKSSDDFIAEMNSVFESASKQGRAVILLDDIDKMAPEEKNSEEYSVLQQQR
jgi:cell division protease FtsH